MGEECFAGPTPPFGRAGWRTHPFMGLEIQLLVRTSVRTSAPPLRNSKRDTWYAAAPQTMTVCDVVAPPSTKWSVKVPTALWKRWCRRRYLRETMIASPLAQGGGKVGVGENIGRACTFV